MAPEMQALTTIDYVIMAVYFTGTMILGLYLGRNIKTGKDFFIAGRTLPWWAIGMSLVVTDIGAVDIVGIAGSAYNDGLVLGNFDWLGSVPIMIISAFLFIPYFWRAGVYTIPEFLGRRYNATVQTIVSAIWLAVLAFNLGIMLYATAEMAHVMMGWPISYTIVFSAIFVGLYTMIGGLSAVVYTDAIQCVVMMAGCGLALCIGLYEVGGITGLQETIHAMGDDYKNHFELVHPADGSSDYPWSGILLGLGFVLAPAYWIGNQSMIQRSLGARSEFEATVSFIWGSFLKLFIPILMVVPGVIALAHNPDIQNVNQAVPILIRDTLPPVVLGVFFAAFLAAFMSSVDSSLNSSVTLFTTDFYKRFIDPGADDVKLLTVGRVCTAIFIVWGIASAFYVWSRGEGIYSIIQTVFSIYQGPSLSILLLGVLWSRTTSTGAITGLCAGILTSSSLLFIDSYSSEGIFRIGEAFLYIAWWAFCVSFTVAVIVSLFTKREPEEKLEGLVFGYKSKEVTE